LLQEVHCLNRGSWKHLVDIFGLLSRVMLQIMERLLVLDERLSPLIWRSQHVNNHSELIVLVIRWIASLILWILNWTQGVAGLAGEESFSVLVAGYIFSHHREKLRKYTAY
jgi:hypothetical protein